MSPTTALMSPTTTTVEDAVLAPPSASDCRGAFYGFRIAKTRATPAIVKLGRAKEPRKRRAQWARQCRGERHRWLTYYWESPRGGAPTCDCRLPQNLRIEAPSIPASNPSTENTLNGIVLTLNGIVLTPDDAVERTLPHHFVPELAGALEGVHTAQAQAQAEHEQKLPNTSVVPLIVYSVFQTLQETVASVTPGAPSSSLKILTFYFFSAETIVISDGGGQTGNVAPLLSQLTDTLNTATSSLSTPDLNIAFWARHRARARQLAHPRRHDALLTGLNGISLVSWKSSAPGGVLILVGGVVGGLSRLSGLGSSSL
ncbi:hypothetical protein DFH07DRAFT_969512 [Mycena maculata]|uniref:Uncharacterized protein n=1 Tax=Mycena maculata TaxID=230809 RepID=A0AAD7MS29_9AGAR|nr:hypothetical protein DFH07DRAFT_969512 [Mycena maculata]